MIRLPFFVLSWVAFLILRTMMIACGWVLVPIAILFRAYDKVFVDGFGDKYFFTWDFMWLWDNDEEGIAHYGKPGSVPYRIFYSSVIRNPANNLRYVRYLSLIIDPANVQWVGSFGHSTHKYLPRETIEKYDSDFQTFWSLTWCGPYSNIRIQWNMLGRRWRFWLGWKIYPEDIYGIPEWDHRLRSAGFATQFRRLPK